ATAGSSIYFAGNGPQPLLVVPNIKPTFINEGTFNRTVSNNLLQCNVPFENKGTANFSKGIFLLLDDYKQTAGTTTVASPATLAPARQPTLPLVAGNLYGTGTIRANVVNQGAVVTPGTSTAGGNLIVAGNYTQQAGGTLTLRIKDATSGIDVQAWGKLGG